MDRALRVWSVVKTVSDRADRSNLGLNSAGIAFFALLSLFPTMAALVMVWSLFADPVQLADLLGLLGEVMPAEAHAILSRQLSGLITAGTDETRGWAAIFSLMFAAWSAVSAIATLIRGVNSVYGIHHRPGLVRRILSAVGLTLVLFGPAIVAIVAVVVAPVALSVLPIERWTLVGAKIARMVLSVAAIVLALGLIYRYAPNRRGDRPGWLTPGTILAAVLWLAVSSAFSAYLARFSVYNEVYGSLGAMVALLMWLYLSAYVVLLGGALNAAIDHARDSEAKPIPAEMSPEAFGRTEPTAPASR